MSDQTTARLALPFLQSGQAQKELTHNEALALLDIAVQPIVEAVGLSTPPADPIAGQCWIVGANPLGAWGGKADALAGWTDGGWRFVAATEGMSAWNRNDMTVTRYVGGRWEIGLVRADQLVIGGVPVVGPRQPAVGAPIGGDNIDGVARQAITNILTVLQRHGLVFP
ncbi:DUF2793 domain-containing protein [Sphingomonas sp. CARO-RG-8B-R24-01]|uniref:DUF2793 domain-containing protein n=1 Tax=Sphingomonas sp. CARO-RG-8B-R24-01 TaxID=2914831 RepID=UPI001F58AF2E|nr:DUF2793 domain-containing protein [Sphingomonas sp. CARO-RG-8B-R24-01]